MIEEAIGWMAIIWVANSMARLLIPYKPRIEKYLCVKCWTFWITLAITFNPITAAVAAIMAAIIDVYLNNIEIKL